MADHPYIGLPQRALWSRGVARRFDPTDVVTADAPLIAAGERVASMGSCFAANLVPYIEGAGIEYVRTEQPHPSVAMLPEHLGYRDFSAAYGNVYTTRQMRQLLERATGAFTPHEDRWHGPGMIIDPFRPGMAYPASTDLEFDALMQGHLAAVRQAFASADVVVLTLGLTEAWESAADGAVFPACPGTINGTFDPTRHLFRNFTVAEVTDDLLATIDAIRGLRPATRFILTVSPVPLVATASGRHVLEATTYSKSVLRVAAAAATDAREQVSYFPAYELVTGPQAPWDSFEADRRSVTREAIDTVMSALLGACDIAGAPANAPTPAPADSPTPATSIADVARRIAEAECDEALLDAARADAADDPEAPGTA